MTNDAGWRWRFPSPQRRRRVSSLRPDRRRGEDPHDEVDKSHHSSIGISSARFLLSGASQGQPPIRAHTTSMSPGPRSHHHQRRQHNHPAAAGSLYTSTTPFLTMALMKLDQLLPEFCTHLGRASFENISRACAVLDSSLATASPNTVGSPHSPRSPRSPNRGGGFLQWLPDRSPNRGNSRSLSPPTATSSAMALESEWDTLQHGFLVLATAEYLYQDVQQVKKGHSLRGLYEYVILQLAQVHATLCEPFLSIPAATASRENKYITAAKSVSAALQCLLTLCQTRIQLIDIQSNLFTVGFLMDSVKESMCNLLVVTETTFRGASTSAPNVGINHQPQTTTASSSDPVKDALLQELKIWKHLMEAISGIERSEFFSTLVSLRRCQTSLNLPARTRLEKWFDESCRVLVSLLPIYFDRVSAFAKPLYGFDPAPTTRPTGHDWEAKVIEFLRKQEKSGGPPTVVAVVLDALGAENLHIERGFEIDPEDAKDMDTEDLPDRILWPAVFMRSTMHLDASSPPRRSHHDKSSTSSTDVIRKRSSKKLVTPEWGSPQASSDQPSSRLFGSTSTRNLDLDVHAAKPKNHILEYGPEGTATTWPHNEWAALVSLLEISPVPDEGIQNNTKHSRTGSKDSIPMEPFRMVEELVAVTYRHSSPDPEGAESETKWGSLERAVRMFGVYANSDMNAVDPHAIREHEKQRSSFHIVSLSKYLSMVVMVKDEEESHFLRRRNPLTDEEIREFMDGIATHWNVSRLFSRDRLPAPMSKYRIELLHDEWDNVKILDLIRRLKIAFGLRPTSYPLTEGHRGISFLGISSPKKTPRRPREAPMVDDSQSAATLFLGNELATLFDV